MVESAVSRDAHHHPSLKSWTYSQRELSLGPRQQSHAGKVTLSNPSTCCPECSVQRGHWLAGNTAPPPAAAHTPHRQFPSDHAVLSLGTCPLSWL